MIADLEALGEPDELAPKMLEAAAPILTRNFVAALDAHSRTGDLRDSIRATTPKKGKTGWHLSVRPTGTDRKGVRNMEKMVYLDMGTSKQPARPVLSAVVSKSEGACIQAMQRVFDEATK